MLLFAAIVFFVEVVACFSSSSLPSSLLLLFMQLNTSNEFREFFESHARLNAKKALVPIVPDADHRRFFRCLCAAADSGFIFQAFDAKVAVCTFLRDETGR